jgi:hypothetical protein
VSVGPPLARRRLSLTRFDGGMAKVVPNKKFFFIDKQGTRITPTSDQAFDYHEDLAAVIVGGKVGYIPRDGFSPYRPFTTLQAVLIFRGVSASLN